MNYLKLVKDDSTYFKNELNNNFKKLKENYNYHSNYKNIFNNLKLLSYGNYSVVFLDKKKIELKNFL